jgi:hypothetical protein
MNRLTYFAALGALRTLARVIVFGFRKPNFNRQLEKQESGFTQQAAANLTHRD